MKESTPEFDAGNWVKLARLCAVASAALSAVMVAILLMVKPPNQCPDWYFRINFGKFQSLWELFALWGMPITIATCFVAIRWNWFARKMMESEKREVRTLFFGRMKPPEVPVIYLMIPACVSMSLTSQLPLVLLVSQCLINP